MTNKKIFDYIENILEGLQPTKNGSIKDYAGSIQKLNTFKSEIEIEIALESNKTSSKQRIKTIDNYIKNKCAKKPILTCYTKQYQNYYSFTDSFFLVSLTENDFNGLQLKDANDAGLGVYPDISRIINNYDISNYDIFITIKYNDLLNMFKTHKKIDALILNDSIFEYQNKYNNEIERFKIGFNCEILKIILLCLNFKPDDDIVIYQNKNKPTTPYYIFNNKTGSKGLILPVRSIIENKTE